MAQEGCRNAGASAPAPGVRTAGCRRWGVAPLGVPPVGVPPVGAAAVPKNRSSMSEKLADHGVLVPVVPPGAVPGSPGPDTTIPTSAINAAAATRMPGRRYHGEAACREFG